MEEINDSIELGGNIELNGFSKIDRSNMVIVKKIVGTYAKKLYEHGNKIDKISLHLKNVHQDQGQGKFEIHAKVISEGKPITSETINNNLFFALDDVLKKIEVQFTRV